MNKYILTSIITVTAVAIDQITKYLVRLDIPLYSSIDVFPFFNLTHLRNSGVAFGMCLLLGDAARRRPRWRSHLEI